MNLEEPYRLVTEESSVRVCDVGFCPNGSPFSPVNADGGSSSYYQRNRERIRAKWRRHYHKIKNEVFDHYGRICKLCGFSDERALSIDHINGGGTQHRKEIQNATYRWLKKNNFPADYQTLCMNCQFIKKHST